MYVVIYVTAKDEREAKKIATRLLEDKLVACANIISGIQSMYWWQGKIDQSREVLIVLKSKKILVKKIIKAVKSVHSYDCPEVIALPIVHGSNDYLQWINDSLRTK